jgi:hypothetical protein
MSGFSAEWLALREPYDAKARDEAVLDAVAAAFCGQPSVSVVDLACGAGAIVRALGPRLPERQVWRLVDNNLSLLAEAAALGRPPNVTVSAQPVDLARDLEAALDGPVHLVTTSALLDLVSAEWLDRLALEAAARRLPVYAALTYQGRASLEPAEPFDLEMIAAVNRHQRGDKGFGPALGPEAGRHAVRGFERVGYHVLPGASDWVFGRQDREIQLQLLAGWAVAATELGDLPPYRIATWLAERRNLVVAGQSTMRVGHVDLFATPIASR